MTLDWSLKRLMCAKKRFPTPTSHHRQPELPKITIHQIRPGVYIFLIFQTVQIPTVASDSCWFLTGRRWRDGQTLVSISWIHEPAFEGRFQKMETFHKVLHLRPPHTKANHHKRPNFLYTIHSYVLKFCVCVCPCSWLLSCVSLLSRCAVTLPRLPALHNPSWCNAGMGLASADVIFSAKHTRSTLHDGHARFGYLLLNLNDCCWWPLKKKKWNTKVLFLYSNWFGGGANYDLGLWCH